MGKNRIWMGKIGFLGKVSDFKGNCTGAWVTWPERPKGVKDVIKQAEGSKASLKGRNREVGARRASRLLVH